VTIRDTVISSNSVRTGIHGKPGLGGAPGAGSSDPELGGAGRGATGAGVENPGPDSLPAGGGGIFNRGALLIEAQSKILKNTVVGGTVIGGGIANALETATLTVRDSVVTANKAVAANGIHGAAGAAGVSGTRGAFGEDGTAGEAGTAGSAGTNGGDALGGGIYNIGTATILTSTISGNITDAGNGGNGGNGGRGGNGGAGGAGGRECYTDPYSGDRYCSEPVPAGQRGGAGSGADGGGAGNGGSASGAGIFNASREGRGGSLTIGNSTISANVTKIGLAGVAGQGGAAGTGVVDPENPAAAGQRGASGVHGDAGGAGVFSESGVLAIAQVTIAGNVAAGEGGGIKVLGEQGSARVNNSTVAGNAAAGAGGGLFVASEVDPSAVEVISTIIARNTSKLKQDPDVNGAITASFSLIGLQGTSTITGANNLIGATTAIDPKLGKLKNNGGLQATMLPAATSPALGVGANPDALSTDQRGLPRVAGGAAPDIGAVEV
jgi:hypothetical protein